MCYSTKINNFSPIKHGLRRWIVNAGSPKEAFGWGLAVHESSARFSACRTELCLVCVSVHPGSAHAKALRSQARQERRSWPFLLDFGLRLAWCERAWSQIEGLAMLKSVNRLWAFNTKLIIVIKSCMKIVAKKSKLFLHYRYHVLSQSTKYDLTPQHISGNKIRRLIGPIKIV